MRGKFGTTLRMTATAQILGRNLETVFMLNVQTTKGLDTNVDGQCESEHGEAASQFRLLTIVGCFSL